MKWYRLTNLVFLVCASFTLTAQTNNFSKASFIESYKLEVTYNKTTNLVFPAAITSIDRGSQDILVQKATGVENILRVKADVKDFSETSLSIITADGKLYSFVVAYNLQPAYLNINVARITETDSVFAPAIKKEAVIYSAPGMNKAALAMYADSVLMNGSNMRSIHTENSKVSFALNALYIHEDVMFLKFDFKNNSNINFDIDQLHFYIRDKVKAKRTASQEIELTPLSITGNTTVIRGESKEPWIVALHKFTIPDGKFLSIEIMEKNGGRNLLLKVKNRKIMKAKSI
jgi:conjugative transposon TraN protein